MVERAAKLYGGTYYNTLRVEGGVGALDCGAVFGNTGRGFVVAKNDFPEYETHTGKCIDASCVYFVLGKGA